MAVAINFKPVLKANDLNEGQMKAIMVEGKEILIARVDNRFYAASNICRHMGGKLAKGTLEGTIVTCPRHGSQYDLRDGHVVRWTNWTGAKLAVSKLLKAPRPLPVYRVKVEGNDVLVEV